MAPNLQPTRRWISYLVLTFALIYQSVGSAPLDSTYLVSSFASPDPAQPFQILATHGDTGDIYIGAGQELYRLDSDCTLRDRISLGVCGVMGSAYVGEPNVNRLLLVVPSPLNRLITCGTCDGYCETRNPTDLSDVTTYYEREDKIIVTTADIPVVGVVVNNSASEEYLFTGISYTSETSAVGQPISSFRLSDFNYLQRIIYATLPDVHINVKLLVWNEFLYYVIQQKIAPGDPMKSIIGRLCTNTTDPSLESYTQIQLECIDQTGSNYNVIQAAHIGRAGSQLADSLGISSTDDVMYAVFTKENSSPVQSALCLYKMSDIQQRFTDAVRDCITCSGTNDCKRRSIDYLMDSSCSGLAVTMLPSLGHFECMAHQDGGTAYRYARGLDALGSVPVFVWTSSIPTSIAVTYELEATVVITGTSASDLLKINVLNGSAAYMYEEISLESGPILRDMFYDSDKEELTLGTTSRVLKISVANCSQFQSCEECIGVNGEYDGDPYCGWCTLEARCTRFQGCPDSDAPAHWLPYSAKQCVAISDIQPVESLPRNHGQQVLNITIQQLPSINTDSPYQCSFDAYRYDVSRYRDSLLTCSSPPVELIPTIPENSDHVNMTLSIISTATNIAIVSRMFPFYDCSQIKSCLACVSSAWSCDWCVLTNKCTNGSSCPSEDIVITGENNPDRSNGRIGQEFCPQLLNLTENILIPTGFPKSITLPAANLPLDSENMRLSYDCIVHLNDLEQRTSATVHTNGTSILCSTVEYTYPWDVFQLQARVSVRWNNNEIDDIYGAEVTLYTCEVNGNSCSRCLSPEASPARFQCLWCGQECAFRDKAVCTQDALDQSQTDQCGSPVITSFWPTSGPMEGNTRVEVSGTDLGASFSDVVSVMIGDSNCSLAGMESYYQPGLSVSCLTAPGARDGTGRVTVTIAGQGASRQATSSQAYTYTNPTIQSFTPRMGPMAGGTEVTITGSHVGSGRLHSAHFGDVECNIRFVNETTVLCETGRSGAVRNETLRLTIDDSAVRFSEEKFSFLANPQILNLNDPSFDRRSITSGGINMVVIGEGFDLIQDPRTVITYGGARSQEVCSGNGSVLVCPSPSLPGPVSQRRRRDIDSPVQAKLDFDFDGFVIDGGLLTYYRDPVYFNFSETDMILNVNPVVPLTLQGIALNLASEKHDIQVLIGSDGSCPVILLNATHLRCNLPVVKPGPGDYTGALSPGPRRSLPSVVVLNGNLEFQLGSLHYDDDSFPAYIIALVVILIVILVAMVIAMALMYRRSQSNVSKIARQLNAMELKIRHKADAVFQALHVDMSEIRAQVLQHKMPFVSTRDYLLNMMFAGLEHLPPTADPEYVSESMERAMLEFSHLLGQKDFLVRFIDRLEERNLHNKRARVNFASLITVILVTEGKMAYLTEVLMSYIKRDVERAAEKGHMVSLFKRTETIVEKLLSNWIALCMYDFLKRHAAQPLYILYQAIQMQSEKGPVDAITGQAHFSLNFDFIMEQDIQFQEVALAIVGEDNRVTSYVTVLDVDCITQAKQKILDAQYRRQHFVNQCRAHDLDLVWYLENGKSMVLRDVDGDNPSDSACIQLNTIKSYGLHDDCRVGLVWQVRDAETGEGETQYQPYIPGNETYHVYLDFSPADTRNRDYSQADLASASQSLWHLVKDDVTTAPAYDERGSTFQLQQQLDKNMCAPQLLIMKSTISRFLDDFLDAVFRKPSDTPVTIKYLFDFFDSLAGEHCGDDEKVVASRWKSNSLSQRFWVTALSHPSYIFTMRQCRPADQCITVITNMLDDACKKVIPEKNQDPSLSRLVYLKDLPGYIKLIEAFYDDIATQPGVSLGQSLHEEFGKIQQEFSGLCSRSATLKELYDFAKPDMQDLLEPVTSLLVEERLYEL